LSTAGVYETAPTAGTLPPSYTKPEVPLAAAMPRAQGCSAHRFNFAAIRSILAIKEVAMPSALVTPAPDLPPRRAFTVDEILRMQDAGIIHEDENFELIEGEIVPVGPKYAAHELIKSALNIQLARTLPDHLWLGFESSIFLSPTTFVEPDICIYPRNLPSDKVKGRDLLLVVEIAASTLAYDRGRKASLYARYGVHELWVVDTATRRTFVHTGPSEQGWASIIEKRPDEELTCAVIPDFAIRLAEI
jgi:Uma2 family endonuclease